MPTTISLTPVYDRSRVVQDWKCPRARFLGYEIYGRGITKESTSLELFTGITIHDCLATIGLRTKAGDPVDIDGIVSAARAQMFQNLAPADDNPEKLEFAHEQSALVEGMLRGFHRHVWPRLIARYPQILFVEEEMEYPHDGLLFMSKPDLILGNDDEVVYIEYKSTSSRKEGWINSWDTAVQLHSTIKAVEATKGVKVDAVIVQGLYKGYESYGKQSSPFCYSYQRGRPPFEDISYDYKPGYKRHPTWEMGGGVKAWVEAMPEQILADQFPQTAPIFINEDLVESFFRQRAKRERTIADATELIRLEEQAIIQGGPRFPDLVDHAGNIENYVNTVFPQRFDQCQPGFGRPCEFKRICHGGVQNPLNEGFILRTPHHAKELDMIGETE